MHKTSRTGNVIPGLKKMKQCQPPLAENLPFLIHTAKKLWMNRTVLKEALMDKIIFFLFHLKVEFQS